MSGIQVSVHWNEKRSSFIKFQDGCIVNAQTCDSQNENWLSKQQKNWGECFRYQEIYSMILKEKSLSSVYFQIYVNNWLHKRQKWLHEEFLRWIRLFLSSLFSTTYLHDMFACFRFLCLSLYQFCTLLWLNEWHRKRVQAWKMWRSRIVNHTCRQ